MGEDLGPLKGKAHLLLSSHGGRHFGMSLAHPLSKWSLGRGGGDYGQENSEGAQSADTMRP